MRTSARKLQSNNQTSTVTIGTSWGKNFHGLGASLTLFSGLNFS